MRLPANVRARLVRVFAALFMTTAVAGAVIAAAHTPWGRPFLGYGGSFGGCPIGSTSLSHAQLDTFRANQLSKRAASWTAVAPEVFGFKLGMTTRAEVESQLAARETNCQSELNGAAIQCTHLSLAPLPPLDELHLQFNPAQRLVAIDAHRRNVELQDALRALNVKLAALQRTVGKPTATFGEFSSAHFARHRYSHASEEFRYTNVFAKVSATRRSSLGIFVREQYQWFD